MALKKTLESIHDIIEYHKKRNCDYIDPKKLCIILDCFPYENVSDDMIKEAIDSGVFIDTKIVKHKGQWSTNRHHAQRIASLIKLVKEKVELDVTYLYEHEEDEKNDYEINMDDGFHRWRTYLYLDMLMPVIIYTSV